MSPAAPVRYCPHPGCAEKGSGPCAKHRKLSQVAYDWGRGSSTERGYDYRWAQYSRRYRAMNPLCVQCESEGRTTASQHVDHIIPVTGKYDPAFWKPTNHQALCVACHNGKTARERSG